MTVFSCSIVEVVVVTLWHIRSGGSVYPVHTATLKVFQTCDGGFELIILGLWLVKVVMRYFRERKKLSIQLRKSEVD